MRFAIRTGLALAAALALGNPLLFADCGQDHGEEAHEHGEMHEEHMAEGDTCPMVMEAQKAVLADISADFERTSKKLVALAEAIPADKYGWAPSDEVRSISEVFMHVVGANYLIPPAIGAAPAEGLQMDPGGPFATMQKWEAEVTEKGAVIEKLKGSIAYAKGAIEGMVDADMDEMLELFGPPMSRRGYVLVILTHAHEHLGQSIAYARSIGVTPPWSQEAEGEG